MAENMMSRKALFVILMMVCSGTLSRTFGQTSNGTPTTTGASPTANNTYIPEYWQQEVNYLIRVELDDKNHYLRGYEEFIYTNRSPNVIDEIFIHLWPNAFKDQSSAFAAQQLINGSTRFYDSKPENRGFIDSLRFQINGVETSYKPYVKDGKSHIDIAHIILKQPLKPNESIKVSTPFRVKLPNSYSRLGHVAQQYQITQWYPKPAVYDRYGWHPMPYLSQGEFYSEFGTFDVYITLPKNYVVGATGELQNNPEEEAWLQKREQRSNFLLNDTARSSKKDVFMLDFPANSKKTLHYRQDRVHDFAWFCDKQYYIQTSVVELPKTKRKVKTVALFNHKDRKAWKKATEFVNDAVYYYSDMVYEYPYSRCTAVDGALSAGAGMEYPMITVLGGSSEGSLRTVTVHEVGHNWFYGLLANNERRYPWMDESINSYYEHRVLAKMVERLKKAEKDSTKNKEASLNVNSEMKNRQLSLTLGAKGFDIGEDMMAKFGSYYSIGANTDQALDQHSQAYTNTNYGTMIYMKGALSLEWLASYLGENVFDRCMQTYAAQWAFKHPDPSDMQAVFEAVSGENLSWFFSDYLSRAENIDLKIGQVKKLRNGLTRVRVHNWNTLSPIPALVALKDKDGKVLAQQWTKPFIGRTQALFDGRIDWHRAEVNPNEVMVELPRANNVAFNRGLLSHVKPPVFKFLFRPNERTDRIPIYYAPAIGYNYRDGFMLGAGIYRNPFPKRAFEFHALPMYAFANNSLAGSAGLTYRVFTDDVIRKVEFHTRTAFFNDLLRTKNFVQFYFQPNNRLHQIQNILTLRTHHLAYRRPNATEIRSVDDFRPFYWALDWFYYLKKARYDYGFQFEFGGRDAGAIRSHISPHLSFRYAEKRRIHFRSFAGLFIQNGDVPYALEYRLSGSGDPFGDHVMMSRPGFFDEYAQPSGLIGRQLIADQGAFRTLLPVSTNQWLTAVNTDIETPFAKSIRVFANYGLTPDSKGGVDQWYDAGIGLNLFKDVLRFNFPLAGSAYGMDVPQKWDEFGRNITFTLSINEAFQKLIY
jgi:hypothetical protein